MTTQPESNQRNPLQMSGEQEDVEEIKLIVDKHLRFFAFYRFWLRVLLVLGFFSLKYKYLVGKGSFHDIRDYNNTLKEGIKIQFKSF